jgi:hypothetical protein
LRSCVSLLTWHAVPQPRLRTIRLLRSLAPFWLLLAGLFLLVVSGLWLHSADRFSGLSWGLTEMIHGWVGWVCCAVLLGYSGHHLYLHWGPLGRPQRILGLFLLATCLLLMVSGGMLSIGRVGGFPPAVREAHYLGTFALIVLLLLHGLNPWLRRLSRGKQNKPTGHSGQSS